MDKIQIQFFGAARQVTGSKHLLEYCLIVGCFKAEFPMDKT
jgi:hypothetical protein